jgi:hypothetical protein
MTYTEPLSAAANDEFMALARMLNHSPEMLAETGVESGRLRVELKDVRRIFSRASEESRRRRGQTFFDRIRERARLGQGIHDRGEAHAFADGEISYADRRGLARHYPLRVRTISCRHKLIPAGEVWDVSTHAAEWGVEGIEELYVILNLGMLTIETGGRLIVRGNVVSATCQKLTILGPSTAPIAAETSAYHLGILPTPYYIGPGLSTHFDLHGKPGATGADGGAGTRGEDVVLGSSILGPCLIHDAREGRRDGGDGRPGAHGRPGERGLSGGPCKLAEITIRELAGNHPLHLFVQAACGGDGGAGGNGGPGGDGGHGGAGAAGIEETVPAGNGGAAGDGGNGGNGGHGGNGGICSNVYLDVPPDAESRIVVTVLPSVGGRGGSPGRGAPPGHPGQAGRGSGRTPAGCDGAKGRAGRGGIAGLNGRSRPPAAVFINDVAVT